MPKISLKKLKGFIHTFPKVSGFTLIELLVVIGIIAVLSAILLLATSESRNRGKDASIKSNLQTIRTQSAVFYSLNDYSYLPLSGGSPISDPVNPCPTLDSTNMFGADPVINSALVEALSLKGGTGAGSRCANSATSFALVVRLNLSNPTRFWCVDSEGQSKEFAGTLSGAMTLVEPFKCN